MVLRTENCLETVRRTWTCSHRRRHSTHDLTVAHRCSPTIDDFYSFIAIYRFFHSWQNSKRSNSKSRTARDVHIAKSFWFLVAMGWIKIDTFWGTRCINFDCGSYSSRRNESEFRAGRKWLIHALFIDAFTMWDQYWCMLITRWCRHAITMRLISDVVPWLNYSYEIQGYPVAKTSLQWAMATTRQNDSRRTVQFTQKNRCRFDLTGW